MKNTDLRNILFVITLASALFFYAFKPSPKISNYLLIGLLAIILMVLTNDVIAKIKDSKKAPAQLGKQNTVPLSYQIVSNIIGIAALTAALVFFLGRI